MRKQNPVIPNPPDLYDVIYSNVYEVGRGFEITSVARSKATITKSIEVASGASSIILVSSIPLRMPIGWGNDVSIKLTDPQEGSELKPQNDDCRYIEMHEGLQKLPRIFVANSPCSGTWTLEITSKERFPLEVYAATYDQSSKLNKEARPFRCRACRMTTKALAAAVVFTATMKLAPAALVIALSARLGDVGTDVALEFMKSVAGDSIDIVAEKLCSAIQLCT